MNPHAFFSYARTDQAFALHLARRLRSRGASIWVDQIDIPSGSPWDEEIEAALARARCFIVILSPASVASRNVRDEIATAIDHGMRIIPVIHQKCLVPLRISRLQQIDFTGDSEAAFETLLSELGHSSSEGWPVAQLQASDVPLAEFAVRNADDTARERDGVCAPSESIPPAEKVEAFEPGTTVGSPTRADAKSIPRSHQSPVVVRVAIGLLLIAILGGYFATRESTGSRTAEQASRTNLDSRFAGGEDNRANAAPPPASPGATSKSQGKATRLFPTAGCGEVLIFPGGATEAETIGAYELYRSKGVKVKLASIDRGGGMEYQIFSGPFETDVARKAGWENGSAWGYSRTIWCAEDIAKRTILRGN